MSWLLYPIDPSEEYYAALEALGREDAEDDPALGFSNCFFSLLAKFFGNLGIEFTGYMREDGALVADLNAELCREMADALENALRTVALLPEEWRDDLEGQWEWL